MGQAISWYPPKSGVAHDPSLTPSVLREGFSTSFGTRPMKEPSHDTKLKELSDLGSWQRAEAIEKGGWDKMPGQEHGGYAVARACADGLELLFKK
jgi:hypothetical protein